MRDLNWTGLRAFALGLFLLGGGVAAGSATTSSSPEPMIRDGGTPTGRDVSPPSYFEPNEGQTDRSVTYVARARGYAAFFTTDAVVFAAPRRAIPPRHALFSAPPSRDPIDAIKMTFIDASTDGTTIDSSEPVPGVSNYFIGHSAVTGVPHFGRLERKNLYPGISLNWRMTHEHQLAYEFRVAPHTDPECIRMAFGAATVSTSDDGESLMVSTAQGTLTHAALTAFQTSSNGERPVRAKFQIGRDHVVTIRVSDYDPARQLVIDPVLQYGSYFGGSGYDWGNGIVVNSGGIYLTGYTYSLDFPLVSAEQGTKSSNSDVFVSKLNSQGTSLLYSTYIGGNNDDEGDSIAVDAAGNAYVCGLTRSSNFPAVAAVSSTLSGAGDGFVLKLSPQGNSLAYSTYLGGSSDDAALGIAVDSANSAYVTGTTSSSNFPTYLPRQATNSGTTKAFVTKFAANGTLAFSTYLGGSVFDGGQSIALDSSANVYVAGFTNSPDFPTQNPIQSFPTGSDLSAFVTKMNSSGTTLLYSTFLGGGDYDQAAAAIAVDSTGAAYVAGYTASSIFPTVSPVQAANASVGGSHEDAFVSKLAPNGSSLVYSTYLGGREYDVAYGVAVDSVGSAYVTGSTVSSNFPTMLPLQAANAGGSADAYLVKLSPAGSQLSYSTYIGGAGLDEGRGVAVDASGAAFVIGYTASTNLATQSPFRASGDGSGDAFVYTVTAPLDQGPPPTANVQNGFDINWSTDPGTAGWAAAAAQGMKFAIVEARSNLNSHRNTTINTKLASAQYYGLKVGAYLVLDFDDIQGGGWHQAAGSGTAQGPGKWQVDDAIALIGNQRSELGFLAIDVEKADEGIQYPTDATSVNARLRIISDAISEVRAYGLKAIIYTSAYEWQAITSNRVSYTNTGGNTSQFPSVPLWDVQIGTPALDGFNSYPAGGWLSRVGVQDAQASSPDSSLGFTLDRDIFDLNEFANCNPPHDPPVLDDVFFDVDLTRVGKWIVASVTATSNYEAITGLKVTRAKINGRRVSTTMPRKFKPYPLAASASAMTTFKFSGRHFAVGDVAGLEVVGRRKGGTFDATWTVSMP